MKKFALCLSVLIAIPAFAVDILCTGQGNQGELIEIELDLNARANTVTIEGNQYQLTLNNDFVYVWQNTLDDLLFTNVLSRITGTMNVIVDSSQDDLEPNIRAVLASKNKTDLLF